MSSERIDIERLLTAPPSEVGVGCLVIGEVGQAHDGSLGLAHAYIDAIAKAGAHAVKFQTHIAAAESTAAEPWRVRFSEQDTTRYDYWKRMEFTPDDWRGLRKHADERGLLFLSSPFSIEAFELLSDVGVAAWKIASGEVANPQLLTRMCSSRLPVLLSTGLSGWNEIDTMVASVSQAGNPLAVLQSTTSYPCPPEEVGLNVLDEFRSRYGCAVGISDHSGTIYPSMAAVALGARVVELHVTLSREMFGPDVSASITTEELRAVVDGVAFIQLAQSSPVDKDVSAADREELRRIFGKSLVAARDLDVGVVLTPADLAAKKPGTGIPVASIEEVVGRRLTRSVCRDEILNKGMLE